MRRATTAAQLILVALIARNWAYVTTYRLYLDRRVDPAPQSAAVQQFDIDGSRVVPRISARAADRIAFAAGANQDAIFYAVLQPQSRASYAVRWRDAAGVHTIASGTADHAVAIAAPLRGGNGIVELIADGAAEWSDPRVVRTLRIAPHLAILAALTIVSIVVRRRPSHVDRTERQRGKAAWFRAAALGGSALAAVAAAEAALRAAGDRLPAGIAAERHDLGEITRDPRWESSPRYGSRLRARVDAVNEWRYGDIVRMGYIPPAVSPGTLHRFRFITDTEGFRNAAARADFEIAALGDSFTDAMTMDAAASWPSQLERRLGVAVQNYGTAGFGPQQALLVLRDYVAAHRPRIVVLAFFAGNDIFDAEAFEDFQQSGGRIARAAAGWRVKEVFSRADTWYMVSALKAGAAWLGRAQPGAAVHAAALQPADPPPGAPAFDRGMYTATVGRRRIQWAFMPPYLNTLNFSERELRQRPGWALTRGAILQMQQTTASFGGQFVVMFLPFKSQVYWRLTERTLPPREFRAALEFALHGNERRLDVDAMRRNRLAQNRLMQELCENARIPFLDTTPLLESRLERGDNVYFPDESHFNETGQGVVAEALAAFLRSQRPALILPGRNR